MIRFLWTIAALVGCMTIGVGLPITPTPQEPIVKGDDPAPKGDGKFQRGLKKTPKHLLVRHAINHPFRADKNITLPASVAYVPTQLSFWGNNQYGDCVTAEEAFNQDCAGIFLSDKTIQSWAAKYGFLDGAYLTEVMDQLKSKGFQQDGNTYSIGQYASVDFSDEKILQSALSIAPVKIGMDANALPAGAGNKNGWYAFGGHTGQFSNEDHCTSLCGYGPVATMFAAVGITAVPKDWPAKSTTAYLHFTWNTIGVVDHDWIMSTCAEAYVRNPSTVKNGVPQPNPGPGPNPPTPPTPPNPPGPTPVPGTGFTGYAIYQNGIVVDFVKTLPIPSNSVEADLRAAGVSPSVIIDVLKLISDLKTKQDFMTVILPDLLKILADFTASQPKP